MSARVNAMRARRQSVCAGASGSGAAPPKMLLYISSGLSSGGWVVPGAEYKMLVSLLAWNVVAIPNDS